MSEGTAPNEQGDTSAPAPGTNTEYIKLKVVGQASYFVY